MTLKILGRPLMNYKELRRIKTERQKKRKTKREKDEMTKRRKDEKTKRQKKEGSALPVNKEQTKL